MPLLEAGLVVQAFARWNHAFALSYAAHDNLCANNIANNGSDELKQRYLPRLCSGELIGCLGLTEPGAGSDALGSMRTTAVRDGDRYILNGSKLYITNGPIADVCLLYAKSRPGEGSKGITAFVVECDTPGFQVAQKLTKMGFRGSPTAELVLEDVSVPAANIVGDEHQGHRVVMSGLDYERAMVAPINVGMAERARALGGVRPRARAVRQADRIVPDDAGPARRHVRVGRDDEDVRLDGPGRGGRRRVRCRRPRQLPAPPKSAR